MFGGNAAIVQTPAGGYGYGGIAGLLRAAILRLEEIDVTGSRDIEGVALGANDAALFAFKRQAAIADGADEHPSSLT